MPQLFNNHQNLCEDMQYSSSDSVRTPYCPRRPLKTPICWQQSNSVCPDAMRHNDLDWASVVSAWCLAYAWMTSFSSVGEGWRGYIELLWAFLAARSLSQHLSLAVTQPFYLMLPAEGGYI